MNNNTVKALGKMVAAATVLATVLYVIPVVTGIYLLCGILDVLRNKRKDPTLFRRYFLGNGLFTWLLSPFNLLIDLISYKNHGVWKLDQLPPDYRREIEEILAAFQQRRGEIISDIDSKFESGRRGMYVYQWYGKQHIDTVPAFTRRYRYIRTIAVSVFSSRESTSFHFGPLRLTLRVLYNLVPVKTDQIFVECGDVKHHWHDNPLFIFDDTLLHRSVNQHDGRRYCIFMDIMRPSPVPRLLSGLLWLVSLLVDGMKAVFYKNWTIIGSRPRGEAAAE